MRIERPSYLNRLVSKMGSDRVKILTGVRRCGKSYLLFTLFKEYLLESGVPQDHIIEMAFDRYENKRFRDPEIFFPYITEQLSDGTEQYYVLLDEIQLLEDFVAILNSLIARPNVDVYVTGSNAHLLSKDIVTEFRGRGDEIRMAPLSFAEFMSVYEGDKRDAYEEYIAYGGLPAILSENSPEEKTRYLQNLFSEIYIRDIIDRNGVRNPGDLENLIDVLASGIGTLTNPTRISHTFKSGKQSKISVETVERYISYLEDAFLIEKSQRYDVKGRKYIGTPIKYYFSDLGLRNARMNFRQLEETHIMENVIYNELRARGFGVDVGVVPTYIKGVGEQYRHTQLEVDFVCNIGSQRYYIQSAYALPDTEKLEQERASLIKIDDSFKKVIIVKEGAIAPHYDDQGILTLAIFDFLLDEHSLQI